MVLLAALIISALSGPQGLVVQGLPSGKSSDPFEKLRVSKFFQNGDVIKTIDGVPMLTPLEYSEIRRTSSVDHEFEVVLERDGKALTEHMKGSEFVAAGPVFAPEVEAARKASNTELAAKLCAEPHLRAYILEADYRKAQAELPNDLQGRLAKAWLIEEEARRQRPTGNEKVRELDIEAYKAHMDVGAHLLAYKASRDLAEGAVKKKSYAEAAKWGKIALGEAEKSGDPTATMEMFTENAMIAIDDGRSKDGNEILSQGLHWAEDRQQWEGAAGMYFISAADALSRHAFKEAAMLLHHSADLLIAHDIKKSAVQSVLTAGACEYFGSSEDCVTTLRHAADLVGQGWESAFDMTQDDLLDYANWMEANLGQVDQAIFDQTKLLKDRPQAGQHRVMLAKLYVLSGKNLDLAHKELAIAKGDASVDRSMFAMAQADVLQREGKYEEAAKIYDQDLKEGNDEDNQVELEASARAHIALKDYDTAKKLIERARKQNGSNVVDEAQCVRDLGDIAAKQGDNATADKFYRQARTLSQDLSQMSKGGVPENILLRSLRPESTMRAITAAPIVASPVTTFKRPRQMALLIATDNYEHFPRLFNPISDAEALKEKLESDYGFECKLLKDPTKDEIFAAFDAYRSDFNPSDELLVYVAGHGKYVEEGWRDGFLVLKDSESDPTKDRSYSTFIPYDSLSRLINNLSVPHVLLVMDVCFGGTFDKRLAEDRGKTRGDERPPEVADFEMVSRAQDKRTRRVITSGGKVSVPDGRPGSHSPFASRLLSFFDNGQPKVKTYFDLVASLQRLQVQPFDSEFGDDLPGSNFFFLAK